MRSQKEVRFGTPLFDRLTGRSRPHLSLREGLEQAPFPLALHRVGSVLAVKGTRRRFAPWTAPGRSEGMAVYEGKGGMQTRQGRGWSRPPLAEHNPPSAVGSAIHKVALDVVAFNNGNTEAGGENSVAPNVKAVCSDIR